MAHKLDSGKVDIINDAAHDYQRFLAALHECTLALKVPGIKSKKTVYDNAKIRTMFFENKEKISMDGIMYEITMTSKTDMYNNRMDLYNIKQHFENFFNDRDHTNYKVFKKELMKLLKNFDKGYAKHTKKKGNHDFMDTEIH